MGSRERYEEQELLRRAGAHSDEEGSDNENVNDPDAYELDDLEHGHASTPSVRNRRTSRWPWSRSTKSLRSNTASYLSRPHSRRRRTFQSRFCRILTLLSYVTLGLLVTCGIFFPSYSHPPQRYSDLRKRVQRTATTGAGNINNEKVFIAASLYEKNGELVSGDWGKAVRSLVDILGPDNVFLSIYENDADERTKEALDEYKQSLPCESSVLTEHLDLNQIAHVTTPDGTARLKRIAFLAEVRNRALLPLEDKGSSANKINFDKLLYVNDVVFDPVDVANLLFSTNVDETTGRTQYRAACATDFIDPVKFYDRFATRDFEGYTTGVPFYPFFTSAGDAISRKDVQAQKDAVRVKSCWGGMVAFEAKWFQDQSDGGETSTNRTVQQPLRFRAETDTYWDASECCLINADLTAMSVSGPSSPDETGIFMNPYIRVAYTTSVLRWLRFTRRFERLYTPIQSLATWLAGFPDFNPRRQQQPGDEVEDRVWMWDEQSRKALEHNTVAALPDGLHGSFANSKRTATPGQFCGTRRLLYIKENPAKGESKWGDEKVPPLT